MGLGLQGMCWVCFHWAPKLHLRRMLLIKKVVKQCTKEFIDLQRSCWDIMVILNVHNLHTGIKFSKLLFDWK